MPAHYRSTSWNSTARADASLRGLRALAALGTRLDAEPPSPADIKSLSPEIGRPPRPSRAGSIGPRSPKVDAEVSDLADILADLLRREALRHGIDPNAP